MESCTRSRKSLSVNKKTYIKVSLIITAVVEEENTTPAGKGHLLKASSYGGASPGSSHPLFSGLLPTSPLSSNLSAILPSITDFLATLPTATQGQGAYCGH